MRKLDPSEYHTDKKLLTHYLRNYERVFAPWAERSVSLLELGVYRAGSLLMWRDYFRDGPIVGLDMNQVSVDDPTGRIKIYQGEQQNRALLDKIAAECGPAGFDLIVDDCSHVGARTRASFWHLFVNHLKPGGIYVIEDWGTGYWPAFTDGARLRRRRSVRGWIATQIESVRYHRELPTNLARVLGRLQREIYPKRFRSHDYGMIGFLKELVDEVGVGDATLPGYGTGQRQVSMISKFEILHGHAFVYKAEDERPMPTGRLDTNRRAAHGADTFGPIQPGVVHGARSNSVTATPGTSASPGLSH